MNDLHENGSGEPFADRHRIFESKNWKLVLLNPNNLVPDLAEHSKALEYADLGGALPPIVVDKDGDIIDGHHRVLAAQMLGRDEIRAYIPVKEPHNKAGIESLGEK